MSKLGFLRGDQRQKKIMRTKTEEKHINKILIEYGNFVSVKSRGELICMDELQH